MHNVVFAVIFGIMGYVVWAAYNLNDTAFVNVVIAGVLLINILLASMVCSLLKTKNITRFVSKVMIGATVVCLGVFVVSLYQPEEIASTDTLEIIHE